MTDRADPLIHRKALPAISLIVLCLTIGASYYALWQACLKMTEGHFTYGLDDPYIHLAIAKNLAFHGVWGVTQYTPSSASSSPLWSFVLAVALRLGGNHSLWPLLLGIACTVASTLLVYFRYLRANMLAPLAVVATLAVFAIGPSAVLPFTGMEHNLQILLVLIFGFKLMDGLEKEDNWDRATLLVILTALTCLSRYECAFLMVVPFAASLWKRLWKVAGALILGPVLGIGGFGIYSHLHGMPWVPNSILLKGNMPKTSALQYLESLGARTWMLFHSGAFALWDMMLIAVLAALVMRFSALKEETKGLRFWIWTMTGAMALHSGFAIIGIFYRYEAYLVVSFATIDIFAFAVLLRHTWASPEKLVTFRQGLAVLAVMTVAQLLLAHVFWFYQLGNNLLIMLYWIGLVLLTLMAVGPLTRDRLIRVLLAAWALPALCISVSDRATTAIREIPKGCSDIYLQQAQMGRFVATYYPFGRLGANDIGCVSYSSDIHLLDLVGLASDGVRRLRLHHNYTTQALGVEIDRFKPDLIIAYPDWFGGSNALPSSLIQVAHWTIPPITTAASTTVTFYARTPGAAKRLRDQLVQFQPTLPSRVKVEYLIPASYSIPRPKAAS